MQPVFINKGQSCLCAPNSWLSVPSPWLVLFGSITRNVGDNRGYCLMWNCPLAGALQLFRDHSWIASECPTQRCVFAGSAGYSCNRLWQSCERKIFCKRCTYNWKNLLGNGTILFRGFLPNQPWLASQPTSALVCIALYLLYIDKYIEIGTIYDSETFTCMVLHACTVSYEILKSHYIQWNPSSSLSCHLFRWKNETWALEDCRNDQGPVLSPRLVSAASWDVLLLLTVLQISVVTRSLFEETDGSHLCHQAQSRDLCWQEGMNDENNWFWTGMKVQLLKVQKKNQAENC